MKLLRTSQKMGIAAAIMGLSVLLSRFMGLVRDKVISYYYGAGMESDVYFASFVIPDFINYLLAGGYFSITLIPLLASYFEGGEHGALDNEDGWDFFWCVFNWIAIAIISVTLVAMLLSPWLAKLAAPGFDAEALERLSLFLRIILPAQIFFLLGSCLTALLYLRRQFAVPAITPLVYNGAIITGGMLLIHKGMEGFCWGVLAGSLLGNFLLPLLAARNGTQGVLRWRPVFRHRGLKKFILLALPLMVGQSVVVLDEQLLRIFGSLTREGAVSWLNYARRIMLVPVGVVAQAAGLASYPFLASLAAKGDDTRFDETLRQALAGATALVIPLSMWMLAVAEPTIRLIFEQGRFGATATQETALCLQIMLIGVFCWGVQQIVGRAFYARKNTLTPAICGTLASLGFIPIYYILAKNMDAAGIALSSTLSVASYTLLLSLVWRRKHGKGAFAGLGRTIFAAALVSTPASAAAWGMVLLSRNWLPQRPLLAALAAIMASGVVFTVAFFVVGKVAAPKALAPVFDITGKVVSKVRSRIFHN